MGGGHDADLESTGKIRLDSLLSGTTMSWRLRRILHAGVETVRLERSMEARSARVAWGFWAGLE